MRRTKGISIRSQGLFLLVLVAIVHYGNVGKANAFLPPKNTPIQLIKGYHPPQIHRIIQDDTEQHRFSKSLVATRLYSVAYASPTSWCYLTLLALQFGCQPMLTKAFIPSSMVRSTVVLAQDVLRLLIACFCLLVSGSWKVATDSWSVSNSMLCAGIPAGLYLVQNFATIMAYQNLPPITFNVLNQTKTLSAALCCFLIMGRIQSRMQVLSLFLLLGSALVIEKVITLTPWRRQQSKSSDISESAGHFTMGVIPVLLASFISGLAGALSQKNLQNMGRNSYLFSMELSAFSIFFLFVSSILRSLNGRKGDSSEMITKLSNGWTWKAWIPIVTNASGGVIVGLVTKHAGAVRKGFALIFGMLLSGVLQNQLLGKKGKVTSEQAVGGILAAVSLWMHSSFPPQ